MEVITLFESQNILGESPFWHEARQSIFWVDIETGILQEFSLSSGKFKKWHVGEHISLIVEGNTDELILAAEDGLLRFNLKDEIVNTLVELDSGLLNQRCNDGHVDCSGRLWLGMMDKQCADGCGSLYRIDKCLKAVKMLDGLTIPNGLVWSLNHKEMYFIDTLTRKIKCYNYNEHDGTIQFKKDAIVIPDEMGLPDGMTIDQEGMLWVALYGCGAVGRWNPKDGALLQTIKIQALHITNCTFAGDNLDQLIITSARENMTSAQLAEYPQSGNLFQVSNPGSRGVKPFAFLPTLLLCFLLLISLCANAQHEVKPFKLGLVNEIQSVKLSEKRTLNIYLPEDYDKGKSSYPVIYLLDGSANEDFVHIVGLVQFLTMIEAMPKSIVVGIANVDRRRDFTYPTTIEKDKNDYPTTGSSTKFMSFIETELQPFVQKTYRISDQKTIIGQSLGGLFATETLLKRPGLFNNYIIVSPSLWWDNESLLPLLKNESTLQKIRNKQIYISVGTEGKIMEADAAALSNGLKSLPASNNKIFFNPLPNESHLTILHQSVYQALLKLYSKKE